MGFFNHGPQRRVRKPRQDRKRSLAIAIQQSTNGKVIPITRLLTLLQLRELAARTATTTATRRKQRGRNTT